MRFLKTRRTRRLKAGEIKKLYPVRKFLVAKAVKGGGLSSYVLVKEEFFERGGSDEYRIDANKICYASLTSSANFPVKYFIDWSFFHALCEGELGRTPRSFNDLEKKWLTWLVNKSAWAPVFITKNLSEMEKLGIVFDTAYVAQYVMQAATLARYPSECPQIVEAWERMCEVMEPHLALHFAHAFKSLNAYMFTLETHSQYNDNHHAWYFNEQCTESLQQMIEGEPYTTHLTPFRDNTHYYGLNQIWGGEKQPFGGTISKGEMLKFPPTELVEYEVFGNKTTTKGHPFESFEAVMREALDMNGLGKYGVKK